MALWLAAVIALIAVGLMPSGAQAHAGHPRAPSASATALPPTASAEARTGEAQTLLPHLAVRTVVVLAASPVRALGTGACDGTCCNAGCRTGSCCTGAGLAPDTDDAAGPRGPGDRALARALPARTDIVPEALPEPPRS
ncbi:hypothetical protein MKK58_16835 [Methylobacterium sp. J-078]|uniref:hypothetical protein n=1 Tax=Methylobacterium sp. J-078 TaxID=2836657 RepID=UPI001FB8F025|nr:hypothetical protein [Methylobacterium sp. J-078]MCJ2046183.1 hypothetical protein [Methylobacterium sp. J-078]